MITARHQGDEYEIIEVEMKQVPSRANPNEWSYKARCQVPTCRKWIWYNYEGYKMSSCEHNAGFKDGKLLLKRRLDEE